jgi:nickel-type superoxide dismutase maturation protease
MGPGPRRSRLGTVATLVWSALTLRVETVEIAEHSMRPTLDDGDWVVAQRRPRSVKPGDVVILEHPNRPGFDLVKRVSSIEARGVIVLGDDPSAGSVDSVAFGAVPTANISARVLMRYRPFPPRLVR